MATYKLNPSRTEKIGAVRQDTKWKPAVRIDIADTKEKAAEDDENDQTEFKIYTDGSGIGGKIGAAAVLFWRGERKATLRYKLGTAAFHTVYEGECVGALMALKLISKQRRVRNVTICIDNQAAITATTLLRPAPGHYILDAFHSDLVELLKIHPQIHITIRWTPGHQGINGNETADEEAKKAAAGDSSNTRYLPELLAVRLPWSKSALKQGFNKKLKTRAKKLWTTSKHHDKLKRTDPTLPSKKYCELIADLPRKHASVLTQLRTGHIPLAVHLHRIKKADSPQCPCCRQHDETVHHYLLRCPAHQNARNTLRKAIGRDSGNLTRMLSKPKLFPALFTFIASSG